MVRSDYIGAPWHHSPVLLHRQTQLPYRVIDQGFPAAPTGRAVGLLALR